MKSPSAREAKYNFGRLNDTAHSAPVVMEKQGRRVDIVLSAEGYQRLKGIDSKNEAA
jgi:hypothetical protein